MTNLPISGVFQITATYGQQGKYWANGHQGIDIVCSNKNIYATCDGVVRVVSYDENGWGHYVSIGDDNGNKHVFCHLASIKVKVGQKVNRDTLIGIMGTSGNSSGIHLHYQINNAKNASINPCDYLGVPNKVGTYDSKNYQIEGDDDYMTGEQIYNELMNYLNKKSTSKCHKEASKAGIASGAFTDGDKDGYVDNPRAFVTREQLAQVLYNKGITK